MIRCTRESTSLASPKPDTGEMDDFDAKLANECANTGSFFTSWSNHLEYLPQFPLRIEGSWIRFFPTQMLSLTRFVSAKWLKGIMCLMLICVGTQLSAADITASAVGAGMRVKKIDSTNEFIWFNQEGVIRPYTISMLALMEDLGILPLTPINDAVVANVDKAYTQFFLSGLSLLTNFSGKTYPKSDNELRQLVSQGLLANTVENILPATPQIEKLRQIMAHYRQLCSYVWPTLSSFTFRLGQRTPEIAKLRWMLTQLGDLKSQAADAYRDAIYDPNISQAVKHFQARHGLEQTGTLNSQTVTALNTTPYQRVTQMQVTLWRWLALPTPLPDNYVWINLPAYQLHVVDNNVDVLSMRIIVGNSLTPTPLMSTYLTQFTVNPTWTPPVSIIYDELLPKNRAEPGYLARQGFQLRKPSATPLSLAHIPPEQLPALLNQYQLVQEPGPGNALGKFRFSIPNNDAIYLHDTPAKSLFNLNNRALSHGCIRLQNPEGLLQYIMSKQSEIGVTDLEHSLNRNTPSYFRIVNPIAVFVDYHTTWVDEDGLLQIRQDIYKQDEQIRQLMQLHLAIKGANYGQTY
ncbi:L,D-transpeptidase family protein [Shewanella yunxiaonensis]|uniref:L,D-transpeptidase family protein n=1 Tax=Shewanella yunxiaonensis TaxID=2829809 RepID=A0ABX7YY11_9GAMM|nr:L,D-transpeptidase family protein [Shewanella yunxiaonensis]QUN06941.1 L,D-transpeptidase family protein [Shewanella yunxiaonensis]